MTNEERELATILDAPTVDADEALQAELDEVFEEPGMYRCELVYNGAIVERQFREGTSAQAVRETLEMFQCIGEWRVTPVE